MLRVFRSLHTTLVLVSLLVVLSIWGSLAIQLRPDDYATIEEGVLLAWFLSRPPFASTWWVLAMIAAAALLALNTAVCVIDRLQRHVRRRRISARAAFAHLAHLGFLLVLAAHLLGAVHGFRSDGHRAFPGQSLRIPERPTWSLVVEEVAMELAPEGYPLSLEAWLTIESAPGVTHRQRVRVNEPLVIEGVATYLKAVRPSLRGWTVTAAGGVRRTLEVGHGLDLPSGSLQLLRWAQGSDRRIHLDLLWEPRAGSPQRGWVTPRPGDPIGLPGSEVLRWGEIVVDSLAILDVRYDPGAGLALAGSVLLSLSLAPLLLRRTRREEAVPPSRPTLRLPDAAIDEPF